MRSVLALVFVVACSKVDNDHARALPHPAGFDGMSDADQCKAIAPRTRPCHDELLKAELATLTPELKELGNDPTMDGPVSDKEAEVLNRNLCLGGKHFARAALECWDEASCGAFATCTMTHERAIDERDRPASPANADGPSDGRVHLVD